MWIYVKRYSFNRPYFISYDRYYEIKEVLKTNESKMLVPNISLRKIFPSTFYFILIYSFLFISSPFIVRFIGSRTVPLFSESVDNISTDTFDERVYTENKDVVLTVIRPSQNNAVLKIELKNTVNQAVNQDSNAVDKMKKLKELFESGLITKEEYDKKKKEIIDGL